MFSVECWSAAHSPLGHMSLSEQYPNGTKTLPNINQQRRELLGGAGWRLGFSRALAVRTRVPWVAYVCTLHYTSPSSKISTTVKSSVLNITINYPFLVSLAEDSTGSHNEGDTISMSCSATSGSPRIAEYKWYHDGTRITDMTDSKLIVTDAKYYDSGSYRCCVSNAAGTSCDSVYIDITYKPHLSRAKTTSEIVQPGQRASLTVYTVASPGQQSAEWRKVGSLTVLSAPHYRLRHRQLANNETMHQLIIDRVQASDYGAYQVTVKNANGSVEFIFALSPVRQPNITGPYPEKDDGNLLAIVALAAFGIMAAVLLVVVIVLCIKMRRMSTEMKATANGNVSNVHGSRVSDYMNATFAEATKRDKTWDTLNDEDL